MKFWLVNLSLFLGSYLVLSCSGDVPLLTTLPVTEITSNSAFTGGNISYEGSSGIGERGVCWNISGTPTILSDRTINGSGPGQYTSNLTGLIPSTKYFVRAYASNKYGTSFGDEVTFTTLIPDSNSTNQIIADHTVVDRYNDIPQQWIDSVKLMLVWISGMSHSLGYQNGLNLLEQFDARFQVTTWTTSPPSYTDQYLRLGRPGMSGEGIWSNAYYREEETTSIISSQNDSGDPYAVLGIGWSYETTWNNDPGGGLDPVFNVHWAGDAGGGRWGLDANDEVLTGNKTCMDTYLEAVDFWNEYFETHNIPTIAIYTTGPVDGNAKSENGFQRELKNTYIRNYAVTDNSRILFDYADILIYNNIGEKNTVNWNDGGTLRPHDQIHPDNQLDYDSSWNVVNENDADGDHIGEVGALRLAKALWWLLARVAGWDGGTGNIPVSSITLTGQGGATSITTDGSTLQMVATVLPANATNKTVTWSIPSGSAYGTINPTSGLLTAVDNGTVTVRATATDGSNVYGSTNITISGQTTPVSSITVTGQGGATTITTDGATLQMIATVLPANATNKTVTWSITSGSAYGTINPTSGLLTAMDNGTVTVRATATDGSNVYGNTSITIFGQTIPVSSITVSGTGGVSLITSIGGTLQLNAVVLPANATNKNITWSITNGTGQATISSSGLVTAAAFGTVSAKATAVDGSGISGTMQITIASQVVPVTGITISGGTSINTDGGTLQLSANVTPSNATVKTVTWSIYEGQDKATINSGGLVTALDNGVVTVHATANDGSGVSGTSTITITNQVVPVTGISISGGTVISTLGGTLQLSATVTPSNATDKSVVWSIAGGTGQATISQSGLVTAIFNGNVIVRATANGGSNVFGTLTITVTNQTVLVTSITVTASGGFATMTGLGTTLQLNAVVSPANATNRLVIWSVTNGTGQATIGSTGLLTSIAYGTVAAIASAVDGSGVSGVLTINIVSNIISVTGISITGHNGETTINEIGGTLQLTAEVTPADASDKTITWSLNNGTGRATISSNGLVTAEAYGGVTAVATANDGSGVSGSMQIEIDENQSETLLPYINGNLLKVPLKRRFEGKKIGLYDIYGRVLKAGIMDSDIHEFDISKFHQGLYLIVFTDDTILKVEKVVIP